MKLVMRKKFLNEKGFTLIEIIASLVILVVVGALVIITTIKITQGFIFTKMNAETSQKGHIALGRLTKEFTNIISVNSSVPVPASINFDSRNYITGALQTGRSVSFVGSTIELNGHILVDNVSDFVLTYYDDYGSSGLPSWPPSWNNPATIHTAKEIEIELKLSGANNTVSIFTTRVVPRNL
jgi:prepilin-type N-terminal cleavage/methylation domain-containing protein